MCRELELRGITYESQIVLPIEYKGVHVGNGYVINLLVEGPSSLMTYMRLRRMSSRRILL
jgi:hypothetical protein